MIVTMPCRSVITASLLLAAAGCEQAPPAPKPKVAITAPSSSAPSRRVALASLVIPERPSELQPVTDDRPDPEAQRQFEARIAQPAVALVASQSPARVTAIALDDTRRGETPGMTPAGDVFQAKLTEGQRGTMPIKLAAGECAAFIAQGGLGVIEVDLFLTGGDGASGRILAEDTATGPIAVVGGRGRCVRGANGAALDAMLNVAVRRGAGVVLVRQFRR
jgi:hypothetical protein